MGRSRKLDEKRQRATDSREGREWKDAYLSTYLSQDTIHLKSPGVRSSVSFNRVIGLGASNETRSESTKSGDSFEMVTLLWKGKRLNGRWNRVCLKQQLMFEFEIWKVKFLPFLKVLSWWFVQFFFFQQIKKLHAMQYRSYDAASINN